MAQVMMQGNAVKTAGEFPKLGDPAPNFVAIRNDLAQVELDQIKDKKILINVYPSIDTQLCAQSVKVFHDNLKNMPDAFYIGMSMDLPFALSRAGQQMELSHVALLSDSAGRQFGNSYGVMMLEGPYVGLLARGVFILDKSHRLVYGEIAPDLSKPVNYQAALEVMNKIQ